jgi:hypothetical protein
MTFDLRSITIFAVLVGLILGLLALTAVAQNAPTFPSRASRGYWVDDDRADLRRYVHYRHGHRERSYERRQRVKGWHSDYDRWGSSHAHSRRCESRLTVVGEQHVSVNGAKDEAKKAFSQTARWRYGERVMDVDHARDVKFECGRSSVGSVVGQVFHRCELTARPCRGEPKREDR